MMNRSERALQWLTSLAASADRLPTAGRPRPYWSQRRSEGEPAPESELPSIVHRVRSLVREFHRDHYFADVVGFECVDGHGDTGSSYETELERRVGKPQLWSDSESTAWSEADLCDFIEVLHDLAARPTTGYVHSYGGCGFHPTSFSRKSGQALYRWRINQLLETTTLGLRIADSGEDIGRMVHVTPGQLETLINDVLAPQSQSREAIAHAVALFRSRTGTLEEQRSAIVVLAGVLENRRQLLKERLLRKDEGALFDIANNFHLRHRDANQRTDYNPGFLEWIFYWYLATVQLTDRWLDNNS